MSVTTAVVLEKALEAAEKYQAPLLVASTSGQTAEKMLELIAHRPVRLIVINHEAPGAPADWRFDFEIRRKIKEAGHKVIPVRAGLIPPMLARWITKTFNLPGFTPRDFVLEELLGTGGRVCFKIAKRAAETHLVRSGQIVVAVAGKISGADTALVLRMVKTRPLQISLLEVLTRSPSETY